MLLYKLLEVFTDLFIFAFLNYRWSLYRKTTWMSLCRVGSRIYPLAQRKIFVIFHLRKNKALLCLQRKSEALPTQIYLNF